METREDHLLRLASVLDALGADERLIVRYRLIERAFSGNGAMQLQRPKSSAVLMAARFVTTALSNNACSRGCTQMGAGRKPF